MDVVLQQIRVPGHQAIRSSSAAAITGRGPSDAMTAANGGEGGDLTQGREKGGSCDRTEGDRKDEEGSLGIIPQK